MNFEAGNAELGEGVIDNCGNFRFVDDVKLAVNGRKPVEFFGRTGGIIPTPAEILEQIKKLAKEGE